MARRKSNAETNCNSNIFLNLPKVHIQEFRFVLPKNVIVYEYYTISTGRTAIYRDKDGLCDLGQQKILDPCEVSYVNLFINGVLQPHENYNVCEGEIRLLTEDIPIAGAPIIQKIQYVS